MDGKQSKEAERLAFRKGDLFALSAVVLLAMVIAAVFLFPGAQSQTVTVEIWQNGRLIEALPLSENKTVTVGGDYQNTVVIRDGAVWVEESTCPGGDCVRSGKISASGRTLVCLPNRLEVRLVGGVPGDVDMVVG